MPGYRPGKSSCSSGGNLPRSRWTLDHAEYHVISWLNITNHLNIYLLTIVITPLGKVNLEWKILEISCKIREERKEIERLGFLSYLIERNSKEERKKRCQIKRPTSKKR
jgi:hypothetical protein